MKRVCLNKLCPTDSSLVQTFITKTTIVTMLASRTARRLSTRYVCLQCRQFSSSKRAMAEAQAAEVKKLGVIGAGQVNS